tara:strand:+ start:79 stop:390 length:312 start_codon:yes stop_codon:yes gene_type:complete
MAQELSAEQFPEVVGKGNVVVDFFADWCGPCKMMGPLFSELSEEMKDVTFAKVDVQKAQELASEQGVRGIPAIYFYKDGEKVGESIGFVQKDQLKEKIEAVFS